MRNKGLSATRVNSTKAPGVTGNSTGKGAGGVAIAAATKNPYTIAVKYVMSGRNLETNIRKTAKLIAYQIAKKAGV